LLSPRERIVSEATVNKRLFRVCVGQKRRILAVFSCLTGENKRPIPEPHAALRIQTFVLL